MQLSRPRPPRSWSRGLTAILAAVLLVGCLAAVTPLAASAASAAANNWGKIWKKNLRPQADKRYYTKQKSRRKFQSRKNSYTKAAVDAKLGLLVNSVSSFAGGDQSLDLSDLPQVVRSTSLLAPAGGTVLVSSSAGAVGTGGAICSLTRGTTHDSDYNQIEDAGGGRASLSGTRAFPVSKGELLTVNLVCYSSGTVTLFDSAVAAMFAPS